MTESDSSNDSGTESLTWISWFCSLSGHEYFAEVAEDFIEDDFNLTGLSTQVTFYKEAMEMILDAEPGKLSNYLCVECHFRSRNQGFFFFSVKKV